MEKRINPWLWQGGICIPTWLLRRPELQAGAKLCYSMLTVLFGEEEYEEISIAELVESLGLNERQVDHHLAQLVQFGLIAVHPIKDRGSRRVEFFEHGWMFDGFYLEEQEDEVAS